MYTHKNEDSFSLSLAFKVPLFSLSFVIVCERAQESH